MRTELSMQVTPMASMTAFLKSGYVQIYQAFDSFIKNFDKSYYREGLINLNPQKGEKILEIGFGSGKLLPYLADAVGRWGSLYGVEIKKRQAASAWRKFAKARQDNNVEIHAVDAASLPFQPGSLDGILMAFTLDAISEDQIPCVLEQCMKTLRPGGRISVISVGYPEHPGLLFRLRLWAVDHLKFAVTCRPVHSDQLLERAGFQLAVKKQAPMWGLPVDLVLAYKPVS